MVATCVDCEAPAYLTIQGVEPWCEAHAPRCEICLQGATHYYEANGKHYCKDCALEQSLCHRCNGQGCRVCGYKGETGGILDECMDLEVVIL